MKSITEQHASLAEAAIASGKITAALISETLTPLKDATEEVRFSALQKLTKEKGFKESAPRIQRKNGSGVVAESALTEQDAKVLNYMKRTGASLQEATYVLTGKELSRDAKFSESMIEGLVAEWKDYCGATISDADARSLAERGIRP